ncbi:MAG: hypothetical protein ACRYGG_21985 [Janthinobacterium lividum]
MSFLGSLFGGSNPTLNKQIGDMSSLAGNATTAGLSNLNTASSYFRDILSGGGKKSLAPQIASIQKQGGQQRSTLAQFGNRGGGTNATAQTIGDRTAGSVNDLVANLTQGAASSVAGIGSGLLGAGMDASKSAASFSEEQMKNWMDSILGKSVTSIAGSAEGFATGKIFPS